MVVLNSLGKRCLFCADLLAPQMEGVHGYFDHEDIPGENNWGAIIKDEEIFASELVTCVGHQIGIVVAETEAQARFAAKAVKVEYEDLPGAVYSCEEAIEANSYIEVRTCRITPETNWKALKCRVPLID